MSAKKGGNVQSEELEVPKSSQEKFADGDVVAITQAALRIGRLALMTPRVLYGIGHPNEFVVLDVFETESDGVCLALWPCCHRFKDRKTGKKICPGHPAVYFEKVGSIRSPKKGDKSSSLVLPFLGEVLGFDYEEGDEEGGENPKMNANLFGLKGGASGYWAKLLKKLAEDAKII